MLTEHGDFLPRSVLTAAGTLGATVVPMPAAVLSPFGRELLPRLARRGVRLVVSYGSRLDGSALAGVPESLVVVNTYGPTEATVVTTAYTCRDATSARVPIGCAIRGTRTYVLDDDLNPAPVGTPGQLFLAGACLAWGYLGQPGQTAGAFLADPFAETPGERMYATGDRVRLLPDGDLDFVDRVDNQVKLHGFRVELGEVEHRLRECPGVLDAAVIVRDDAPGGAALIGFLAGTARDGDMLAERLRQRLPNYMVPALFVWLDRLPLNRHGKVDRAALGTVTLADAVAAGSQPWRQPDGRPR